MRRLILALLLAVAAQAQVVSFVSSPSATPAASGLYNGLIAFWNLDEESGTRFDAVGDNDLTDYNTTMDTTGIIDGASRHIEAAKEYLGHADNADLSFGNESFTISTWFWLTSTDNAYILDKGGSSGAGYREYYVYISSKYLRFFISNDGTTSDFVDHHISITLQDSTWYCMVAWHNADTDSIYMKLSDFPIRRKLWSAGCYDYNNAFTLGINNNSVGFDGALDLVCIWGRCPTYTNGYAMADSIYNSGNGWRP